MTDVETAREYARANESEKRFAHTSGVAADCGRLAEIFELDAATSEKLLVAAWLHDMTKELSAREQKALCDEFGIPEPPGGYGSPTLHAVTGAHLAKKLFPFVDETVFSAIRYHTTGRDGMSLTDMLLCFADYTESSRKYDSCRELRARFYGKVTRENREKLLIRCLYEALDNTTTSLEQRGDFIDDDTFRAKSFLRKAAQTEK